MEDAPTLLKLPKSDFPDFWIRLPRHKWPKTWQSIQELVVPRERNVYGHRFVGLVWERQFEKVWIANALEKALVWEVASLRSGKLDGTFYPSTWMTQ